MYQSLIRNLKVYPSMELDRAQLHTKPLFPGRVTNLGERRTNLGDRRTSRFWAILPTGFTLQLLSFNFKDSQGPTIRR